MRTQLGSGLDRAPWRRRFASRLGGLLFLLAVFGMVAPAAEAAPYQGVYLRFPWQRGQSWQLTPYRNPSWHGGNNLDFLPPVGQSASWNVLAMHGGRLSVICEGAVSINLQVRYTDGATVFDTVYSHLARNSVPRNLLNTNIGQGTVIGRVYNGSFPNGDAGCGVSTGPHLHLYLPSKWISVDGWTVSGGNSWSNGSTTLGIGSYFPSSNVVPPEHIERSINSNKCLDVSGMSLANGAIVHQWDCWGGANQVWREAPIGNGYYYLINRNSNKCLDSAGPSTANGAQAQQWTCLGGANQQWRFATIGPGRYALVSRYSNKCLDVAGWSQANGGKVQQWDCHWGANQQWTYR